MKENERKVTAASQQDAGSVGAAGQHRPSFPPRPTSKTSSTASESAQPKSSLKWKTMIVLITLVAATYLGYTEVWGVLFLYWVIRAIKHKEAFLIEPILLRENPVLFVVITVLWFSASLYYLLFNGVELTWLGTQFYSLFGLGAS